MTEVELVEDDNEPRIFSEKLLKVSLIKKFKTHVQLSNVILIM